MKPKLVIAAVAAAIVGASAAALLVGISLPMDGANGSGCSAPPKSLANFQPTEPPRAMPEVAFVDPAAARHTIAEYAGRGIVLNFWATWCAPCVREMPALDTLNQRVQKDGIDVLALSGDREGAPVVDIFYRKNGITSLATLIDERRSAVHSLGIRGLPTTVLIDSGGREVGRVIGIAEWDAPESGRFLKRCLAPAGTQKTEGDHARQSQG